ncbi:MAG: pirin family protein [Myxococcota bacterium]
MELRRASERGGADYGWLQTQHTFSFARYYDPHHLGFRSLRVINEDRVVAGAGFPKHPHRDMEIISYVVDGELEHKDTLGTGSVIRPGDVQRMSAGRGIAHSEYNPSSENGLHFLQIWIQPSEPGGEPGYAQKTFSEVEKRDVLRLVASPDGAEGSLSIRQDARVYVSLLSEGASVRHELAPDRGAWIQVVRGEVQVVDELLGPGDGAKTETPGLIELRARSDAEFLLFDLA